jgi:hypothetical protein
MIRIRRQLRAWTTVWLIVQALSLAALVPRDCCAAHRSHAAPEAHAPADEAPCPMHRAPVKEPECSLESTCNGPDLALPLTSTTSGMPPSFFSVFRDTPTSSRIVLPEVRLTASGPLPDSPPPRV